jgi:hypothetical protein
MRLNGLFVAIVAVSCVGVVGPRRAAADEWNRRTVVTFSHAVEVPGQVLPAGTYTFQLPDSSANRHVVQVFDRHGRMLATVLTIPTASPTPANRTRMTFEEQPAGAPFPIKTWFYPGRVDGEQFIYPTEGIQIDALQDLEMLTVRTRNSTYEIMVLRPRTGDVLVRGGLFFPAYTLARLAGSSLGGSIFKRHGVYVGFSMELQQSTDHPHNQSPIPREEVRLLTLRNEQPD